MGLSRGSSSVAREVPGGKLTRLIAVLATNVSSTFSCRPLSQFPPARRNHAPAPRTTANRSHHTTSIPEMRFTIAFYPPDLPTSNEAATLTLHVLQFPETGPICPFIADWGRYCVLRLPSSQKGILAYGRRPNSTTGI